MNYYILYAELRGFYIQGFAQERGPVLVVKERKVLDANGPALRRGVRVGMPLSVAKALVEAPRVVEWKPEDYEELAEKWLDIASLHCAVIEPEGQASAYFDFSDQPEPQISAARMLAQMQRETGLEVNCAAAPNKQVARLAAAPLRPFLDEYEGEAEGEELARLCQLIFGVEAGLPVPEQVFDAKRYLASQTVDRLGLGHELSERLQFLGCRTGLDVQRLPWAVLCKQFGAQAEQVRAAVDGRKGEPVRSLYPKSSLRAERAFESAVENAQELQHALADLAGELGERLKAQESQAHDVRLAFENETGSWEVRERRFVRAAHDRASVLNALQLLASEAPGQPAVRLVAQALRLEKVQANQPELWGARSVCEPVAALNQLQSRFGSESVRRANELPVPRRVQLLREWRLATGWR
jgi:nucleotidyltransferase/DNA polymerase involved in DNA repair